MSHSSPSQFHVADKAQVAQKIANEVVSADASILSLLVLDIKDGVKVLALARSPNLPQSEHATPEMVEKFAVAAVVVWGASRQAAELMGRREFIVGAFREQLVLLVDLMEYEMLLAVRLSRSSNAEHVHTKIASLLGLR